ncbi:MAG: hypothetical protein KF894_14840 [Labilithrix sp.]|nr:hypothetical protein [Labilithrix sp.]
MASKDPVIGTCRLCDEVTTLRDSHIVPKWAYKRITSDDGPGPTQPIMVEFDVATITNKQFTEHLLCDSCEQLFSAWENSLSQLLVQKDGAFPWLDLVAPKRTTGAADSAAVDATAVAKFACSVFWRASVTRKLSVQLRLGPYEESIRRYLRDEEPFPDAASLIVSLGLSSKEGLPSLARFIVMPQSKRDGGCHIHAFAMCGALFYLVVGGIKIAYADTFCFVRKRIVDVRSSDDLMRSWRQLTGGAEQKGKLSRI